MHMICQSMLNSCGMGACRHSAAATTISCQIWQQKYGAHLRPFLCAATVVRPVPSTHLQGQACGQRSGTAGAHLCCVYGAVADRIRRRCQSRRSPPPANTQQVIAWSVEEWHANESFCMCHGTCKSSGAVEVANRCPTVEDIAEFQGNVLNSGGISIWALQGRTTYMATHLRGCCWGPHLENAPGSASRASIPVRPHECE